MQNIPKFETTICNKKPFDLLSLEKDSPILQINENNTYQPLSISNIQLYNPTLKLFNNINSNNDVLSHKYNFQDMNSIYDNENNITIQNPVFIKYSPLLDPIRYMIGRYEPNKDILSNLPTFDNTNEVQDKLNDPNNTSYVDNFFSYLSGQMLNTHNIIHGIDYYGSFLGIQDKFMIDVADDIEYLHSSPFFISNNNNLFIFSNFDNDNFFNVSNSRCNRQKINIDNEEDCEIDFDIIETDAIDSIQNDIIELTDDNIVYAKTNKNTTTSTKNSKNSSIESISSASDDDSEEEDNSDEDNSDEDNSDEDNSDEDNSEEEDNSEWETASSCSSNETTVFAYINKFPIQGICLQKCVGTFDSLFESNSINSDEAISAIGQIIMTLLCYQKCFQFTHNDLHTNNIMYVYTDLPFLYYRFNNLTYKIPTYGKIYKIIDFGRAIYNYKGIRLCSDSFAPNGDAATQYNTEPYMNDSKPRLDPNYSFDLCRLGCSLYDFIIDDDSNEEEYSDIQKLVVELCLDDNNKNILYKKNGEERYPNFKLYKMIARTVHNHIPENLLKKTYFTQFLYDNSEQVNIDIDIDSLPIYA